MGGPWPNDDQLAPLVNYPKNISVDVVAGLNYVIQKSTQIRVCLMPFEMLSLDIPTNNAVKQAADRGVLMVAAAGGSPMASYLGGSPFFPTGKDLKFTPRSPQSASGVILVGAMVDLDGQPGNLNTPVDAAAASKAVQINLASYPVGSANFDDYFAPYSNYTTDPSIPFFAAPGGWNLGWDNIAGTYSDAAAYPQINSTIPSLPGAPKYSFYINNQTVQNAVTTKRPACGSSFAAAHVAGMLAYMTDPHSIVGFVVGGRGIPTLRTSMTNNVGAYNALNRITHNPLSYPTGWAQVIGPFGNRQTVPTFMTFYNDVVTTPAGNTVPVANFYTNNLPINYP